MRDRSVGVKGDKFSDESDVKSYFILVGLVNLCHVTIEEITVCENRPQVDRGT